MVQLVQAIFGIGAPVRARHIAAMAALALAGAVLGGCSSINEKMAPVIGDALPQWAGGEPQGLPPRRGTPEYDAYMKERELKQLKPEPANANASGPASTSGLQPVH